MSGRSGDLKTSEFVNVCKLVPIDDFPAFVVCSVAGIHSVELARIICMVASILIFQMALDLMLQIF